MAHELAQLPGLCRSGAARRFFRRRKTINATQSTVSKAVRQLEDELGLVLLDREISPSRLTTAGEIVFRRAVAMLAEKTTCWPSWVSSAASSAAC